MDHILQQDRIEDYSRVRTWTTKRAEASITCKDLKTYSGKRDQVVRNFGLKFQELKQSGEGMGTLDTKEDKRQIS